MTPERWRIITEILDSVRELPPDEADVAVRAKCAQDLGLYEDVRCMLAVDCASGPLDRSPWSILPEPPPTPFSPAFRPGEVLAGRYHIVRFLNRGGMGEVYEVHDLELPDEPTALKTLLPAVASDAGMIARFKKEIMLSRKIGNPNVCRVFDLARHTDGSYFLTMEFLPGETLAARLARDGPMSPEAAAPLVDQMAEALHAAHSAGIIHRDLKPSNVMLVPRSGSARGLAAVLTDFGLARSFVSGRTATHTSQILGTFDYMAPELFAGRPATVASDIYALGLIAYKMTTSEVFPPVRTSTATGVPPYVAAIYRTLDPNPAARFNTALDFARAFSARSVVPVAGVHSRSLRLTTRRALIAGGGLMAGVALYAAIARLQEQGPLFATTSPAPLLMLTPFTNATNPGKAAERALAMSLLIEKQLGQSSRIRLLSRDRISRSWKSNPDHKGDMPLFLTPRDARDVAIREKADSVVFGSFTQVAEEWTVRVRLERMGNSPDFPQRFRSRDFRDQDPASAAFSAVNWIRQMLAESATEVQSHSRRPEELTTNNWHALQEYALGDDAWRRNQREAALDHLREALLIDPQFALAAARLADLDTASGRVDEGLEYYEVAERLLIARNLTDRESLQIRGIFAFDTGRYAEADHVFALWSDEYPEDAVPLYYRSTVLDRLGRSEEASPLLDKAIQRDPVSYAFAYRRAHRALLYGSLDQAQARCDEVARMAERDWTDQLYAAIAFGRFRFGDVWNRLEHMHNAGSVPFQSRAMVLQACLRVEQGRDDEALELLSRSLLFDRTNGLPKEQQLATRRRIASIHLATGNRAAALRECRAIIDARPGVESAMQTACILAKAGEPVAAESLLPTTSPKWPIHRHWYQRARAAAALARGNVPRAFAYLRDLPASRSDGEWPLYLAQTASRAGDAATTDRLLAALFANPGRAWYYAESTEPGFVRSAIQLAERTHFITSHPDLVQRLETLKTDFTRR